MPQEFSLNNVNFGVANVNERGNNKNRKKKVTSDMRYQHWHKTADK